MNLLRIILLVIILGQVSSVYSDTHICYFSLNNEKEFSVMKSFSKEISSSSKNKINVSEYQTKGSNPVKSFLKMLGNEKKCDGLVISGHHTGSFGGSRASGSLGINFLETMSCKAEHKDWFNNLSAVWLQGCRTLGVTISADEYEDFEEDADFHTSRLEEILDEDHLEQSLQTLNTEFSAVLDQDNPLSTRYLRAFPNATVFGWTQTAPGVKAKSEKSLPFHIAHISRILDPNIDNNFNDPFSSMNEETKSRYFNVLNAVLTRSHDNNYVLKNRISEEVLIDGWLEHGQAIGNFPFSFNNPDLQAYKSLSSGRPLLVKAKALGCNLQNNKSNKNDLSFALKEILKSKKMIFYNMDTISSLLNQLRSKEILFNTAKETLKNSQNFVEVLRSKLIGKGLGITRLLEYYSLYTILIGKRNHRFENIIRKKATKILSEGNNEEYNIRDYKETLLKSLYKNRIFTDQYLVELISHIKDPDMIIRITTLCSTRINLALIKNIILQTLASNLLTTTDKFYILNELTNEYEEMYNFNDYSKDINLFISNHLNENSLTNSSVTQIYDYLSGVEKTNEFLALKFYKKYLETLNEEKRYTINLYRLTSIFNIILKKKYREIMSQELLEFYLHYLEHAFSYKIKTQSADTERLNKNRLNKAIILALNDSSQNENLVEDMYNVSKFGRSYYQIEKKIKFLPDTQMSLNHKFTAIKNIADWLYSTKNIRLNNKSNLFLNLIESLSSMSTQSIDVKNKKELNYLFKDLIKLYIKNHQRASSGYYYPLFSSLSDIAKNDPETINAISEILREIITRSIETKDEENHWNLINSFLDVYLKFNIKEIVGLDAILNSVLNDPIRPIMTVLKISENAFQHIKGKKQFELLKKVKKVTEAMFAKKPSLINKYQTQKMNMHLISAYFKKNNTLEDKILFYEQNNINSLRGVIPFFAQSIRDHINIEHENFILSHKLYDEKISPYDPESFDNDFSDQDVYQTTLSLVEALTNNKISEKNKINIINYIMNAGYLTDETLDDLIDVTVRSNLKTDYKLQFIDKIIDYISHFKTSDKYIIFADYETNPIREKLIELAISLNVNQSLTYQYISNIFLIPSFNNYEYFTAMEYLKKVESTLHQDTKLNMIFNESLFQAQRYIIELTIPE